jgi:hypothetical protein
MHTVNKALLRSREAALNRLREDLRDVPLRQLPREQLIKYGLSRAKEGAGGSAVSIDISFTGTLLMQAAAVHGMHVHMEKGSPRACRPWEV